MRIICVFIVPIVTSFPASNFLIPGRQENYLSSGFWKLEQPKAATQGGNANGEIGSGFWPSVRDLKMRRWNKWRNIDDKENNNNDDGGSINDNKKDLWDLHEPNKESIESSTVSATPSTVTITESTGTTTIFVPTMTPLPPTPIIDEVELRQKLLKGTPPRFLQNATDEARVTFAKIGMGGKMTKKQLRKAYSDWADQQSPEIKNAFYEQRQSHEENLAMMRKKLNEKSIDSLNDEAKRLYDIIQTIHDNEDLTLDENTEMIQEVLNKANERARQELHEMKRRFAISGI